MPAVAAVRGTAAEPATVYAAFAGYGALWGPYLALLPEVRQHTGASGGLLGAALLVAALAAMPAMLVAGPLLDRFGRPVTVTTVVAFAAVAPAPVLADSVPALFASLALFGFGSGACNVVVVALAAATEADTGHRVMNRAHALFSLGVLACSVGTGVARACGVPGQVVTIALSAAVAAATLAARDRVPGRLPQRRHAPTGRPWLRMTVLLCCLLGGLAMIVESGVQQWSAIFLADVTRAPVGLSSAAPGVFAASMVLGRLGGHRLSGRAPERLILLASGALAGIGVLVLSAVDDPLHGLLGVAVVGGAISVCTPTVYGLVGRGAAPADRGAVLGSTASLASVGLLLGPVLVGQIAGQTDLRVAIAALAVPSAAVCLLALGVSTRTGTADRRMTR